MIVLEIFDWCPGYIWFVSLRFFDGCPGNIGWVSRIYLMGVLEIFDFFLVILTGFLEIFDGCQEHIS